MSWSMDETVLYVPDGERMFSMCLRLERAGYRLVDVLPRLRIITILMTDEQRKQSTKYAEEQTWTNVMNTLKNSKSNYIM